MWSLELRHLLPNKSSSSDDQAEFVHIFLSSIFHDSIFFFVKDKLLHNVDTIFDKLAAEPVDAKVKDFCNVTVCACISDFGASAQRAKRFRR